MHRGNIIAPSFFALIVLAVIGLVLFLIIRQAVRRRNYWALLGLAMFILFMIGLIVPVFHARVNESAIVVHETPWNPGPSGPGIIDGYGPPSVMAPTVSAPPQVQAPQDDWSQSAPSVQQGFGSDHPPHPSFSRSWSPEVEELYAANLYSTAQSAARALGGRMRDQLAKSLISTEMPREIFVVAPVIDAQQASTLQVVHEATDELLRQLDSWPGTRVQLVASEQAIRDLWRTELSRPAPAPVSVAPAAPTAPAAPVPLDAEASAEPQGEVADADAHGAADGDAEAVASAPPEPGAVDSVDEPASENLADKAAELANAGETDEIAERPADSNPAVAVEGQAEVVSMPDAEADASSTITSNPQPAAAPLPYLVRLEIPELAQRTDTENGREFTTITSGTMRATLEGPGTAENPGTRYVAMARFEGKTWVDRQAEFMSRTPNSSGLLVLRSELQSSAIDAHRENLNALGYFVHDRLTRAPGVKRDSVQLSNVLDAPELESLVVDRFVQELSGPGGTPMWREALLVRSNEPLIVDAFKGRLESLYSETQHVQWEERQRRRDAFGQMVIILGGIGGLYWVLDSATRGYFTGRLRTFAVLAVVVALLGYFFLRI